MKRILIVAMVLVLVLSIAQSAVAKGKPVHVGAGKYDPIGAGARKVMLYNSEGFECDEGAVDTTGEVYGFVILNTNSSGDLIIQVSLKGAPPDAEYDLWVNQDPGACPLEEPTVEAALLTNQVGNGKFHYAMPRLEGATRFWVTVQGGELVLRSTAVELD